MDGSTPHSTLHHEGLLEQGHVCEVLINRPGDPGADLGEGLELYTNHSITAEYDGSQAVLTISHHGCRKDDRIRHVQHICTAAELHSCLPACVLGRCASCSSSTPHPQMSSRNHIRAPEDGYTHMNFLKTASNYAKPNHTMQLGTALGSVLLGCMLRGGRHRPWPR